MPFSSLPNSAVKITRKDITRDNPGLSDILPDEKCLNFLQHLNETIAASLGDWNNLKPFKSRNSNETMLTSQVSEPSGRFMKIYEDNMLLPHVLGFRLFSWSVDTRPIKLDPLFKPIPRQV